MGDGRNYIRPLSLDRIPILSRNQARSFDSLYPEHERASDHAEPKEKQVPRHVNHHFSVSHFGLSCI
jgi:hypothetical protein